MASYRSKEDKLNLLDSKPTHLRTRSSKISIAGRKTSLGRWAIDAEDEEPDEILFSFQMSNIHSPNYIKRNTPKSPDSPIPVDQQENLAQTKSENPKPLDLEKLKEKFLEPSSVSTSKAAINDVKSNSQNPMKLIKQVTAPTDMLGVNERLPMPIKRSPRPTQSPTAYSILNKEKESISPNLSSAKLSGKGNSVSISKLSVPSHIIIPQRSQRSVKCEEEESKNDNLFLAINFHQLLPSVRQELKEASENIKILQPQPPPKKSDLPNLGQSARKIEGLGSIDTISLPPFESPNKIQSPKTLSKQIQSSVVDLNMHIERDLSTLGSQGKLKSLLRNLPEPGMPAKKKLGFKKEVGHSGDGSNRLNNIWKMSNNSSAASLFNVKPQNVKFIRPLPTTKASDSQFKLAQALVNMNSYSQDLSDYQVASRKEGMGSRQVLTISSRTDFDEAVKFLFDPNQLGSKGTLTHLGTEYAEPPNLTSEQAKFGNVRSFRVREETHYRMRK